MKTADAVTAGVSLVESGRAVISAGNSTQQRATRLESTALSGIHIPIMPVPEPPAIAGMSRCEHDARAAAGTIRSASARIAATVLD